jgi:hypothetical protein
MILLFELKYLNEIYRKNDHNSLLFVNKLLDLLMSL